MKGDINRRQVSVKTQRRLPPCCKASIWTMRTKMLIVSSSRERLSETGSAFMRPSAAMRACASTFWVSYKIMPLKTARPP